VFQQIRKSGLTLPVTAPAAWWSRAWPCLSALLFRLHGGASPFPSALFLSLFPRAFYSNRAAWLTAFRNRLFQRLYPLLAPWPFPLFHGHDVRLPSVHALSACRF